MTPIVRGDVLLAPWRGEDGVDAGPHYVVVLGVDETSGAVLAVFTTSVKEGLEGGRYAFTQQERAAACFSKACRYDPGRVMLYPSRARSLLRKTSGHLPARAMAELEAAVRKTARALLKYAV